MLFDKIEKVVLTYRFLSYQNGSKDDHKEARAEHETAELNLSEEQSAA